MPSAAVLQREHSNYKHLVMDIFWFGLALSATARFLQMYAIRLGASPIEIGWLSSMPAIVMVLSIGLSGWWRARYPTSHQAVIIPATLHRLAFLLPAFAPLFPLEWQPAWLIASIALPAIPQGVANIMFMVMLREAVRPERLTTLFSRRSVALNIATITTVLAFGLLLEKVAFPLNYQLMYALAYIFAMVSAWHVSRVRVLKSVEPAVEETPAPAQVSSSFWQMLRSPQALGVVFITLISHAAFFGLYAIVPLRLQRELGAAEGFMAAFSMMEMTGGLLGGLLAAYLASHIGSRRMVVYGMLGTSAAMALLASAPHLLLALPAGLLSGLSWTTTGIGVLGYFSENTAAEDVSATAHFHRIAFVAVFIGPMLGSGLVNMGIGILPVMAGGVLVNILGAALIYSVPVLRRRKGPQSPMVGAA